MIEIFKIMETRIGNGMQYGIVLTPFREQQIAGDIQSFLLSKGFVSEVTVK
jgi:hypothetical protein